MRDLDTALRTTVSRFESLLPPRGNSNVSNGLKDEPIAEIVLKAVMP
jgi:hypothetical protein